jgi:predicted PolB exonuclease-like 3'-5' exonuclease
MIYFDIETMPNPALAPLYGFEEDDVKTGNLKDAQKIQAKREEAFNKHMKSIMLSPTTSMVCAVGVYDDHNTGNGFIMTHLDNTEFEMISALWRLFQCTVTDNKTQVAGFNIKSFDLPYLVKRSWALHISVPKSVFKFWNGRVYFNSDLFVDLREMWTFGDKYAPGTLDDVLKFLGFDGKTEGVSGGDFYKLLETDKAKALEYLKRDCLGCMEIYSRIGASL